MNTERTIGQELALVCAEANLPVVYVSQVLCVSRMTIYVWSKGGAIRRPKHNKIRAFIRTVKGDLESGRLPATSVREARSYLQPMCEDTLKSATGKTWG
jgi:hypothetical protein